MLHLQGVLQEPHHHQVSLGPSAGSSQNVRSKWRVEPVPCPPGVGTTSARRALCSITASPSAATCATLRPTASSTPPKVRWFRPFRLFRTESKRLHVLFFFFYPFHSRVDSKDGEASGGGRPAAIRRRRLAAAKPPQTPRVIRGVGGRG